MQETIKKHWTEKLVGAMMILTILLSIALFFFILIPVKFEPLKNEEITAPKTEIIKT